MELKPIHVAILLLQALADLQQGAVHYRIIQSGTNLQGLLDVILQPLSELVGDLLIVICKPGHFLIAPGLGPSGVPPFVQGHFGIAG